MNNTPILIAGAGPVGLTLALLLHQQGHPVKIYEAAETIKPLGVGINLLPHSVRILYQLDLGKQLNQMGIPTSALHYYNKFGQLIWQEPRGVEAGYRYPQYSIHRGKFQMLLLAAVQERLGTNAIHTGHELVSWRDSDDHTKVFFICDKQVIELPARGLVAADGIHSTARQRFCPGEGPPIYGGRVLWRGITRCTPFLDGSTMFMVGHQNCKFVAYPIEQYDNGDVLVNWIAERSQTNYHQPQDWNREGSIGKFLPTFADWEYSWVNIPKIIQNCQQVFEIPLSDRNPLPRWTWGRTTLIGDAAHPMYPIGSNGASQGILDAEQLSKSLTEHSDVHQAFLAYESIRRPATSQLVFANRQNGPEQVMQIVEQRAPNGFDHIHDVISQRELEDIALRYKKTAGFTVEVVNR